MENCAFCKKEVKKEEHICKPCQQSHCQQCGEKLGQNEISVCVSCEYQNFTFDRANAPI